MELKVIGNSVNKICNCTHDYDKCCGSKHPGHFDSKDSTLPPVWKQPKPFSQLFDGFKVLLQMNSNSKKVERLVKISLNTSDWDTILRNELEEFIIDIKSI